MRPVVSFTNVTTSEERKSVQFTMKLDGILFLLLLACALKFHGYVDVPQLVVSFTFWLMVIYTIVLGFTHFVLCVSMTAFLDKVRLVRLLQEKGQPAILAEQLPKAWAPKLTFKFLFLQSVTILMTYLAGFHKMAIAILVIGVLSFMIRALIIRKILKPN